MSEPMLAIGRHNILSFGAPKGSVPMLVSVPEFFAMQKTFKKMQKLANKAINYELENDALKREVERLARDLQMAQVDRDYWRAQAQGHVPRVQAGA